MGARVPGALSGSVHSTSDRVVESDQRSRVQAFTDGVISRGVLWAAPRSLRPNHVTFVRFLLVPAVYYLFRSGHMWTAFALFTFGASTDFLDGALARTRGLVTELGAFIDPLADKLLVGAALLALGTDYLVIQIILVSVFLELIAMFVGAVYWRRTGGVVRSNVFGKLKMILLSLGLSLFLLGRVLGSDGVVGAAVLILWCALGFAVASALKLFGTGISTR